MSHARHPQMKKTLTGCMYVYMHVYMRLQTHSLQRLNPTRASPFLTPKTSSHRSSLIHFHSHNHVLLPSATTTSQVQPLLPDPAASASASASVGRFHVNVGPKALMRPRVMLGLRAFARSKLRFKGWLRW
jgi:hypothetical protein